MAKFQYVAMDTGGKEKKGIIEAETEQDAVNALKKVSLRPKPSKMP